MLQCNIDVTSSSHQCYSNVTSASHQRIHHDLHHHHHDHQKHLQCLFTRLEQTDFCLWMKDYITLQSQNKITQTIQHACFFAWPHVVELCYVLQCILNQLIVCSWVLLVQHILLWPPVDLQYVLQLHSESIDCFFVGTSSSTYCLTPSGAVTHFCNAFSLK